MHLPSKKVSLIILGILAGVCSRTIFFFIDDPEGPNLLIVAVLAAIIYCVSVAAYSFDLLKQQKLVLAACIQILLSVALALFLK